MPTSFGICFSSIETSSFLYRLADPVPACMHATRLCFMLTGNHGRTRRGLSNVRNACKISLIFLVGIAKSTRKSEPCTNTMSQHGCKCGISTPYNSLGVGHIIPQYSLFGRHKTARLFDNKPTSQIPVGYNTAASPVHSRVA